LPIRAQVFTFAHAISLPTMTAKANDDGQKIGRPHADRKRPDPPNGGYIFARAARARDIMVAANRAEAPNGGYIFGFWIWDSQETVKVLNVHPFFLIWTVGVLEPWLSAVQPTMWPAGTEKTPRRVTLPAGEPLAEGWARGRARAGASVDARLCGSGRGGGVKWGRGPCSRSQANGPGECEKIWNEGKCTIGGEGDSKFLAKKMRLGFWLGIFIQIEAYDIITYLLYFQIVIKEEEEERKPFLAILAVLAPKKAYVTREI
jgi:hypothetical protein